MGRICEECGGTDAATVEDYDPCHGCTCPTTRAEEASEETDEEPEECIY